MLLRSATSMFIVSILFYIFGISDLFVYKHQQVGALCIIIASIYLYMAIKKISK